MSWFDPSTLSRKQLLIELVTESFGRRHLVSSLEEAELDLWLESCPDDGALYEIVLRALDEQVADCKESGKIPDLWAIRKKVRKSIKRSSLKASEA